MPPFPALLLRPAVAGPNQPQPNGPVSDDDRRHIEEALAAALLLLYRGHRTEALARIGVLEDTGVLPLGTEHKIGQFAIDRSQKIADGINSRMAGADDPEAVLTSIEQYHKDVLAPYMLSWTSHQAMIDAYQSTPSPDGTGRDAAQTTQWEWAQRTEFLDDCTDAMEASPAPLDDLLAITGGPPPIHERCQCTLSPI